MFEDTACPSQEGGQYYASGLSHCGDGEVLCGPVGENTEKVHPIDCYANLGHLRLCRFKFGPELGEDAQMVRSQDGHVPHVVVKIVNDDCNKQIENLKK